MRTTEDREPQDGVMTGTLILLRHGESEWNAKNLLPARSMST